VNSDIALLDIVAVTADIREKAIERGQVGTVVDILDGGRYEVEFSDDEGRTYAQAALAGDQLIVLRYRPRHAA
jgi:membrane protein implicated in regulation of membrane protease activity